MRIKAKLERLERRSRGAVCRRCDNRGGCRILVDSGDEPLDLEAATACSACRRCPPVNGVKVIDVSDINNMGLTPAELLVAKARITGCLTPGIDYAAALAALRTDSCLAPRSVPASFGGDEENAWGQAP